MQNLTTVAAVQNYTGTTGNSAILAPLIAAASSAVLVYLSQAMFQATYTEKYNGTGTKRLILRQGPVTAVAALSINGSSISAAANAYQAGYVFDDLGLYLTAGCFPQWPQAVSVTYTAGYPPIQISDDPTPILPVVMTVKNLYWQSDVGVVFFGGAALVKVNAPPAAGEYTVDSLGNYTFAVADVAKQIVITYNIIGIPQDIIQATNEIVGLNLSRRQSLRAKSKTIDSQTEVYITDDWPPSALQTLEQWQRTFPNL